MASGGREGNSCETKGIEGWRLYVSACARLSVCVMRETVELHLKCLEAVLGGGGERVLVNFVSDVEVAPAGGVGCHVGLEKDGEERSWSEFGACEAIVPLTSSRPPLESDISGYV